MAGLHFPVMSDPVDREWRSCIFACLMTACLYTIIGMVSADAPHILAQQQLTKNEWSIFITLLVSYPHYAPHETLLASLTLLSPGDCRKMLQEAEQVGPKTLKRELKPVHRALCGLRAKLNNLSPYLKISLIRDLGYALIRAENKDL